MGSPIRPANMLTARHSFTRIVFFTALCLVLIIYVLRPSIGTQPTFHHQFVQLQNGVPVPHSDCSLNGTRLRSLQHKYALDDTIEYALRSIRFKREDVRRKSITKLEMPLFPRGFDTINLQDPQLKSTCLSPLEVSVPNSPFPINVDASDLLFGISTTFSRISDQENGPIKEWSYWLTDGAGKSNGAGLILRLVDASDAEIQTTKEMMRKLGIDVKVYPVDGSIEMAKRYLSLVPAMYNDSSRFKRKFFVMCDDDTFFPSMHALLESLSRYNQKSDLYIGTLSEDVNNIQRHGSQAFGGAGVFISVPLVRKIAELYDVCSTSEKLSESDSGWGPQGDILLRKCIYEHTEVRLTLMRKLHQLDITGDPSGFYEAGLAPLSLHHFKGGLWHIARPYEGAQVGHVCGEDCFLQRFQTSDDFIISNGYSVAYYPKGIDFDVEQMERTFSALPTDFGWNLDFMLGPQRNSLLETGRKASWELMESSVQGPGSVVQTYVRKANDSRWTQNQGAEESGDKSRMFESDGIIELVWISE